MKYTEKYHLPQWELTDRIQMEDFNNAMVKVEEHLAQLAEPQFNIGSYRGNGKKLEDGGIHVVCGFRPRFLIISTGWSCANMIPQTFMVIGEQIIYANSSKNNIPDIDAENSHPLPLQYTEDGFTLGNGLRTTQPLLNETTFVYGYIAFR